VHSLEEVKNAILETKKGKYLDIHNWVFEPHSFIKIFENISLLNYTSLKIKRIIPTLGHEFFVFFKKEKTKNQEECRKFFLQKAVQHKTET
jgi:hypothetical protein